MISESSHRAPRRFVPRGKMPVLHNRTWGHKVVSAIGAFTLSLRHRRPGPRLHRHPGKNITTVEVIAFLRALLRHFRGKVILVSDRRNRHRCNQPKLRRAAHPRLTFEWLPPYAPEPSPMNFVCGDIEYHRIADHGLVEPDDMYDLTRCEAEGLTPKGLLLRSFDQTSGLPIRF